MKGGLREIPSLFDFGQWPLLEVILLNGSLFTTDLEVRHARLKALRIVDPMGRTCPVLDCPFLEELRLYGDRFEVHYAKNLDSWCPRLKRVTLVRVVDMELLYEEPGSLEFVHGAVEELKCRNLLPSMKRIACPKLTKPRMSWDIDGPKIELAFPVVGCPNLLRLELHGYDHLLSNLSSILAVLPDLESLKIDDRGGGCEDAVLEHSRIKDLVFKKIIVKSLVLIMPSLVHVDIGESFMEVLKVFSMAKTVTVDFDRSFPEVKRRVVTGGEMRTVDLSDVE